MSTLKGPLVSLKLTVAHMSHMKAFALFFFVMIQAFTAIVLQVFGIGTEFKAPEGLGFMKL